MALWKCLLQDNSCIFVRVGLDLYEGVVKDNKKAGVLEPTISKIKSLKFATEAAITILRIDDLIKLQPEKSEGGKSYSDAYHAGDLDGWWFKAINGLLNFNPIALKVLSDKCYWFYLLLYIFMNILVNITFRKKIHSFFLINLLLR